ncbi:hypothetical protein RND81_11G234100 [Saponaria officinalis]|uniref:Uncharacterized protein n=1 Tax=Saponaria officinalis TaxID=3572 RepID=A0AAW1HRJ4_SAPOF
MMQDMWNAPPGFRVSKSASAPCSPAKPIPVSRTRSESFHIAHKVPVGDTPYVRAKHVQLVDKDPEKAIPLFWAAINAGDRVDSALKDMAIVMKQQNRADEAIEAIKSLRSRCSDQAQESLDNILLDLYKRCGRLDDQISLLRHKLYLIHQGLAFNGKRTKTARSQGKKFQVSVEQEATRLLGNLGWALMQQNNYKEAEDAYRRALSIAPDSNKMCNLGICLMKQGRVVEAKETLRRVKPAIADGPRGMDSHLKAYERAQQMLADLESEMMKKAGDSVSEQSRLFNTFLGSSSIWQPQPCRETYSSSQSNSVKKTDEFPDENISNSYINHNILPKSNNNPRNQIFPPKPVGFFNIDAQPFYSSNSVNNHPVSERLKRTRSINTENFGTEKDQAVESRKIINNNSSIPERENKILRRSFEEAMDRLPDDKDFEDAIISAVLDTIDADNNKGVLVEAKNKFDVKGAARLKVFQDITLSLSPRA